MELRPDVSCLQGRNVVLPGGRDKEGRPILLVSIPSNSPHLDIIPALQYLISIFRYAHIAVIPKNISSNTKLVNLVPVTCTVTWSSN